MSDVSGVVAPTLTIRTMIICVPSEVPGEALCSRSVEKTLGVRGTLSARFLARAGVRPWQRRHLIDVRRGTPSWCAGGPVRLLDLPGTRYTAALAAGVRYQHWSQIVAGTPHATPWPVQEARALAKPDRYPLDAARQDFARQPRVLAMRMHNANDFGQPVDLAELEMLQAGCRAYQDYWAGQAWAGDTLLTADGRHLAPVSDSFTDRIAYLAEANRHLESLEDDVRLLALTL